MTYDLAHKSFVKEIVNWSLYFKEMIKDCPITLNFNYPDIFFNYPLKKY